MSPRFCTNIYGQKVLEQICKLDHMFLLHIFASSRGLFEQETGLFLQ